ncbi:MAG: histidine kinase [Eubacteriales bacterium]|nr:histidine kinase [Eubacteriales bacterium]
MLRWYRRLRVYTQIALMCAFTAALLTGYLLFTLSQAQTSAHNTFVEYVDSLVDQTERMAEAQYDSYAKIIRLISFDKDVQEFLFAKSEGERVERYGSLKRALIQAATLSGSITDIVVEDSQGRLYNLADSQTEVPPQTATTLSLSGLMVSHQGKTSQRYLVMSKNIESIDSYNQTSQNIGNVYLVLSDSAFTGERQLSAASDLTLYLADQAGQVVWSNGPRAGQAALEQARRNDPYYFSDTPLSIGYHIYVLQERAESLLASGDGRNGELLVALGLLSLLALLWIAFARNLVSPLKQLLRFIEKLGGGSLGNLSEQVELEGYQEAGRIGNEFNALLEKTVQLTAEVVDANTAAYENRLLAKQFELAHLRSEVNPHFLYNTLETMVGIAYTNGQPEIAEIARSLSLIFKYSIKGKSIVPLREEWKIAQNYLNIQHYRFQDRFDVACPMPKECADFLVPKLILQPMIENAIVHGIEQHDGFCHLTVETKLEEQTLVLKVIDDGVGMSPEVLTELNGRLKRTLDPAQDAEGTGHIGILNVDSRLKLQYGPAYGVTLNSTLGKGTTVELRLPALKEA